MPTKKTGIMLTLICALCKNPFERDSGVQRKKHQTMDFKENADCCSKRCAAQFGRATGRTLGFSVRF